MQSSQFADNQAGKEYKFTLPIAYQSKCLAAIGLVETNLDSGYTYININHSKSKSSLSQLTFHCYSAQNFMANSDDVTISKLYWIAHGI